MNCYTEGMKEEWQTSYGQHYQNGGMHRYAEAAGGDDLDISFHHFIFTVKSIDMASKVIIRRHDDRVVGVEFGF